MGVKGTCRSPNGGGCPFLYALYMAKVAPFHPAAPSPFPALIDANFQSIGANFQQKGAKMKFYLLGLVFSRDFRRQQRAKFKIYFNFGAFVVLLSSSFVVAVVVSTGAGVQDLSRLRDLPEVGSGPLVVCSVPFARFTALYLSCCLQIWLYFAF